jgi:hypothetical protein
VIQSNWNKGDKKMPTQKATPTQLLSTKVNCFGFSTAQSKKPLWFTVWAKGKAQGHADTVELSNVTFKLDKAGQARSRGFKLDGTPSAGTLLKRAKTGNAKTLDTRKTPFLFVCGEVKSFNEELDTTGSMKLRPMIDRSPNGVDAHFVTLDGKKVKTCDRIYLTINGIFAWGVNY